MHPSSKRIQRLKTMVTSVASYFSNQQEEDEDALGTHTSVFVGLFSAADAWQGTEASKLECCDIRLAV